MSGTEDLDALLEILENPIRREILLRLSHETHYPLQLSKELNVSQQAIMKHLKVLEKCGFVRCYEERSNKGGPPRKCYITTRHITITIDVGPHIFNISMKEFNDNRDESGEETKRKKKKNIKNALNEILRKVSKMNKEIENLEKKRNEMMLERQRLLQQAHQIICELFDDYDERKILYVLAERGCITLEELSEILNIREKMLEKMIEQLIDDEEINLPIQR